MRIKVALIVILSLACASVTVADEFKMTVSVLVRDLKSQAPIQGAKVVFLNEQDVWSAAKEKTGPDGNTGLTNSNGIAAALMRVGRAVTKVGVFRYQKTRSVTHQAFKLRVDKAGYKPFYGLVHGVFACVDPNSPAKGELLNEVHLAPKRSKLVSAEHVRPVRVMDISIQNNWAVPGDTLTLRARLDVPPIIEKQWVERGKRTGIGIVALAEFIKKRGTISLRDNGKYSDLQSSDNVYSAEYTLPKKTQPGMYPVHFRVVTDRMSMVLVDGGGKLEAGGGWRLGGYPGPVPHVIPHPFKLGDGRSGAFVREGTFVAVAETTEDARKMYDQEIASVRNESDQPRPSPRRKAVKRNAPKR